MSLISRNTFSFWSFASIIFAVLDDYVFGLNGKNTDQMF